MFPGTLRNNLRAAIMLGKQIEQKNDGGADDKDRNEQRIAEAMRLAELDAALGEQDGGRVGQKQRANIARALVTAPDVLLMDEPTSALDPETADRLMDTIRRLKQEKKLTVVMVTHRLAEARRVSDTIIVMERGRIVEAGATKDIFTIDTRTNLFLDSEK
jgi:D-methionine transport system ATP-binding protein